MDGGLKESSMTQQLEVLRDIGEGRPVHVILSYLCTSGKPAYTRATVVEEGREVASSIRDRHVLAYLAGDLVERRALVV
jgi:hypothetical protein